MHRCPTIWHTGSPPPAPSLLPVSLLLIVCDASNNGGVVREQKRWKNTSFGCASAACHYSLTYCSLWSTRSWSACVTDPDCVKSKNVICTMLCGLSRCVTRTASTHVFNIFSPGEIQICMIFKNRFTNDFFFLLPKLKSKKKKFHPKSRIFVPRFSYMTQCPPN